MDIATEIFLHLRNKIPEQFISGLEYKNFTNEVAKSSQTTWTEKKKCFKKDNNQLPQGKNKIKTVHLKLQRNKDYNITHDIHYSLPYIDHNHKNVSLDYSQSTMSLMKPLHYTNTSRDFGASRCTTRNSFPWERRCDNVLLATTMFFNHHLWHPNRMTPLLQKTNQATMTRQKAYEYGISTTKKVNDLSRTNEPAMTNKQEA